MALKAPLIPLRLLAAVFVAAISALAALAVSYTTVGMITLREVFPVANIFHVFVLLGFFGSIPVLVSVIGIGMPAFMLLRNKQGGRRLFLAGAAVVGAALSFGIWSHVWSSIWDGSMMIVPGAISGLVGGLAMWRIGSTD